MNARRGSPIHKLHRFTNEGLIVYHKHISEFQTAAKEKNLEDVVSETQSYLDEIEKEGSKRQFKVA